MDSVTEGGDIERGNGANIDAEATFGAENTADGTDYADGEYALVARTTPVANLAPFIFLGKDDDPADGRRSERYRLPAADNQSSVRIRWMMMGTWSWYWGIDNVRIWASTGLEVEDWSLYHRDLRLECRA